LIARPEKKDAAIRTAASMLSKQLEQMVKAQA